MLSAPTTDFVSAVRNSLQDSGILNAQICVLDPVAETLVLGPRAASVTSANPADSIEAGLLQGNMKATVSFIPEDTDPPITKGMVIRVLAGTGIAPQLTHMAFIVLGVPVGSINVLTEILCQTNGKLAPVYTTDGSTPVTSGYGSGGYGG